MELHTARQVRAQVAGYIAATQERAQVAGYIAARQELTASGELHYYKELRAHIYMLRGSCEPKWRATLLQGRSESKWSYIRQDRGERKWSYYTCSKADTRGSSKCKWGVRAGVSYVTKRA